MEAFVEEVTPSSSKHVWHVGSSIAVVPLTAEGWAALTIISGLNCACHVSSVRYYYLTSTTRLAGPCCSTVRNSMASPAILAFVSLTQAETLAGIPLPAIHHIPSTELDGCNTYRLRAIRCIL